MYAHVGFRNVGVGYGIRRSQRYASLKWPDYDFSYGASGDWSSLWAAGGTGTVSQASSWGRMVTGSTGSYTDVTYATLSGILTPNGTYRLRARTVSADECFPFIQFRFDNDNCLEVQLRPASDQILFRDVAEGTPSTLDTESITIGTNDIVEIEIYLAGSTVEVRCWLSTGSRPATATFTATDTSYDDQAGFILGIVGGDAAAAKTVEWQVDYLKRY